MRLSVASNLRHSLKTTLVLTLFSLLQTSAAILIKRRYILNAVPETLERLDREDRSIHGYLARTNLLQKWQPDNIQTTTQQENDLRTESDNDALESFYENALSRASRLQDTPLSLRNQDQPMRRSLRSVPGAEAAGDHEEEQHAVLARMRTLCDRLRKKRITQNWNKRANTEDLISFLCHSNNFW
ncbi:hypothetical protein Ddc_11008 [Ditylenchus destructor]|nr:hypothetical protein Ddc_11008 [Ditylenchus destructor]